jgi:hypothetical protein
MRGISSTFKRVDYKGLKPRQQENYNFQKVAGRLADYGFNCLKLNDDWQGADFLAVHIDKKTVLRIQLKGRPVIARVYVGQDLHVAFLTDDDQCYVYPHDVFLEAALKHDALSETKSWTEGGKYTWSKVRPWLRDLLDEYKI